MAIFLKHQKYNRTYSHCQVTQKTMHNQTLQKWATLSNTVTRSLCPRHGCRMRHSTKQVKDSGIFTIFVGGGWGGGVVIIFARFGGGQS